MFDEIYCGRCGVDVPVEKTKESFTYIDGKFYVVVEAIGKCPECNDTIGDKHFFRYAGSESMNEKEIELFQKPLDKS